MLLLCFRKQVGKGYGSHWRGIIFRRRYKNLEDLIVKAKRLFLTEKNPPRFLSSKSDLKFVWPGGEELLFRAAEKDDDYWEYHGHEYPFVGFDELTNWPTSYLYESFKSVCRSSFPGIPKIMRATTNPYGVGHAWVKRYFVDWSPGAKPNGALFKKKDGLTIARFTSLMQDNPHLYENDPEYVKMILSMPEGPRKQAWMYGDWDIAIGSFFDGFWDPQKNIIKQSNFIPPPSWVRWRALDWGTAKPYSVGWYCKNNDGVVIRYRELYGWGGSENKGSRETAREVAAKVWDAEQIERDSGIRLRTNNPADSSIFANIGTEHTIAEEFLEWYKTCEANKTPLPKNKKEAAIVWTKAAKGPDSRVNGWAVLRTMMSEQRLMVTEDCHHWLRTVPTLPVDEDDEEDVDSEAEDHAGDETRYAVVTYTKKTRKKKATSKKAKPGTFDWLTEKKPIQHGPRPLRRVD